MGLFDKIFSNTAGNIVESVGNAFDQNFTSEEERLEKKTKTSHRKKSGWRKRMKSRSTLRIA